MSIDYGVLKTELTTDPNGLGLAAKVAVGDMTGCAAALNEVRAGAAYEADRGVIPAHEVVDAIVPAEWSAATAVERDRIAFIISAGQVNLKATNVRNAFTAAFGAGTQTRANLIAALKEQTSRARILFGQSVSQDDCSKALQS